MPDAQFTEKAKEMSLLHNMCFSSLYHCQYCQLSTRSIPCFHSIVGLRMRNIFSVIFTIVSGSMCLQSRLVMAYGRNTYENWQFCKMPGRVGSAEMINLITICHRREANLEELNFLHPKRDMNIQGFQRLCLPIQGSGVSFLIDFFARCTRTLLSFSVFNWMQIHCTEHFPTPGDRIDGVYLVSYFIHAAVNSPDRQRTPTVCDFMLI